MNVVGFRRSCQLPSVFKKVKLVVDCYKLILFGYIIHNSVLKFRVLRLLRKPFQCGKKISPPPFELQSLAPLNHFAPDTVDNSANFSLHIQALHRNIEL